VNSTPRLSIGLAVYNGENFLAQSIESLLGQTFHDFELIISDNASKDGTADICARYAREDSRIRYFCQQQNIGSARNHNFTIHQARGELFKTAAHDDLYGRDLLKFCVEALDNDPAIVLAHSWSAVIDKTNAVTEIVDYPVNTGDPRAPERLRSMLFDGWGDDEGGVVRTDVLRRTKLHGSHHFADRTFTVELALNGPFYMVEDHLYFRRQHAGQGGANGDVRKRCANLDPRRASRLRHPTARLYGEYVGSYATAIARAPLSAADKAKCYQILGHWVASRALPVAVRSLTGRQLQEAGGPTSPVPGGISVEALVAGADRGAA
jgi:glycosyltransferase involved in cell wall biosynthesis